MADQSQSAGWQALRQCRSEIAAAWEQIAAARQILHDTRWLLQRWAEQARDADRPTTLAASKRRTMAGTYVTVETGTPRKRRRRRTKVPAGTPAAEHRHASVP